MKIKVSNTNTPVWRNITVKTELPAKLKKLEELSKNLWWVWNSEAKSLFHDLDRDLWRATGENPVMVLQKMTSERLDEILKDKEMLARIDTVYENFKEYMKVPLRKDLPSVSYFSMEYGLCSALKIYSGGLGILAGDYIKEASDYRVNMTAVGFLYRYGYFTQSLSLDGQQIANYEPQNFNQLPIDPVLDENGQQLILEVPYPVAIPRLLLCRFKEFSQRHIGVAHAFMDGFALLGEGAGILLRNFVGMVRRCRKHGGEEGLTEGVDLVE